MNNKMNQSMKIFRIKTIKLMMASILFISYGCNKDYVTSYSPDSGPVHIKLSGSGTIIKGFTEESTISSVQILVCRNGIIQQHGYFTNSSDMTMQLEYSESNLYNIYALVNIHELDVSEGESIDKIMKQATDRGIISFQANTSGTIMMFGETNTHINAVNNNITINVYRLLDKINVEALSNMTGKEITITRLFIAECPEYCTWISGKIIPNIEREHLNSPEISHAKWKQLYDIAFNEYITNQTITDYWSEYFNDAIGILSRNINKTHLAHGDTHHCGIILYTFPYNSVNKEDKWSLIIETLGPEGLPGWYTINIDFQKLWNAEMRLTDIVLKSQPAQDPFSIFKHTVNDTALTIGEWGYADEIEITI